MDLTAEDPRISDLFDQIETQLAIVPITDRAFVDEAVYLDGRSFARCSFTRCTLISRLGIFRLTESPLHEAKEVVVAGPSLRLYELMRANLDAGGELGIAVDGYRGSTPGARA